MSDACCSPPGAGVDPAYRRVLWIALATNATMFVAEVGAGIGSGSLSLLADAIDFFGDAANYGVSLAVLGLALRVRAVAAAFKAGCMAAIAVFVLLRALWLWHGGAPPESLTMGLVAVLALAANVGVALLLYRFRSGDSNMRSVWICSRNDAIGNLAVMAAALSVHRLSSAWPDLLVAAVMAGLALWGALSITRQARAEWRAARA